MREVMLHSASDILPLNGTGQGENDPGLILALVRFGDMPCVLLGQDRRGQTTRSPLGPGALREARRGMRLAAELNLPLVTVIDTAGAALSKEAEEGGLAGEIARCIADMVSLDVPTISLLLGQGTGGGALALIPADRVLAARHGWLSPLPPEGASAILHHDIAYGPDMATRRGIRPSDLQAIGIVDLVMSKAQTCRRIGGLRLFARRCPCGSGRLERGGDRRPRGAAPAQKCSGGKSELSSWARWATLSARSAGLGWARSPAVRIIATPLTERR